MLKGFLDQGPMIPTFVTITISIVLYQIMTITNIMAACISMITITILVFFRILLPQGLWSSGHSRGGQPSVSVRRHCAQEVESSFGVRNPNPKP